MKSLLFAIFALTASCSAASNTSKAYEVQQPTNAAFLLLLMVPTSWRRYVLLLTVPVMKSIEVDTKAIAESIDTKKQQSLPPTRVRALAELRVVLDGSMSLRQLYGKPPGPCRASMSFVMQSLDDISIQEVFEISEAKKAKASPKPKAPKAKGTKGTKRSETTEAAANAIIQAMTGQGKQGKNVIMVSAMEANATITEAQLGTAWQNLRSRMLDEGAGPAKVYWMSEKP